MRTLLLALTLAASATAAGAADSPTIRLETGALTALTSTADLGAAISVGAELPKWLPLIGTHLGFVDALRVNSKQAIGASVSLRPAATDDGWRIGATVTKPDPDADREWTAYLRYGVAIKF